MKIESNKNWTTCLRLNTGDGSPRVFLLNSHFLGSVPNSSNLPKDGEAVYKLEDNGNTTTIKYYFKDDIVYLQDAVYAFNPKKMGKSEEEIQKLLKKRHSIYDGVKGIESTIARKDGIYYHTLKIDYNNIDWKELHKRAPETFTDENPSALKYSEAVPKLLEDGYVKQ